MIRKLRTRFVLFSMLLVSILLSVMMVMVIRFNRFALQEQSINALLRRQGDQVDQLSFGDTALDLSTGMLLCKGQSIRLSAREFDMMRFLLRSGHRNISKATLLSRVWGLDSNAVENHVEVYVAMLRKKLSTVGSNVKIVSIRRLGYHLEVPGQ